MSTSKYDVDSDHLKCNFCTQWFRCSMHYANIQRYSLKACPHCLTHFNYTLLHPDNYRIFKVILLDTTIAIKQPLEGDLEQHQKLAIDF
jgi:hypothetical protein